MFCILPGIVIYIWADRVCGHSCTEGFPVPPTAHREDAITTVLEVVPYVLAAWWSSHAITGKNGGEYGDGCVTFPTPMSKDIPCPSKWKPKSFGCYCFPALHSFAQGFLFLFTQNQLFSPLIIQVLGFCSLYTLYFFYTLYALLYDLKIIPCEFTGKFFMWLPGIQFTSWLLFVESLTKIS